METSLAVLAVTLSLRLVATICCMVGRVLMFMQLQQRIESSEDLQGKASIMCTQ
ncbi:hypothetical protein KR100_12220 [Synechococcus sp. KORDI-100]|nr:hypothetical protein KR100_12220 [Synechococcus sp. KORDI-100]